MSGEEPELPLIIFNNRKVYDKNVLKPGCPRSRALFELLGHEKWLHPWQLVWVTEMGFRYEITGDIKQFKREIERLETAAERLEDDDDLE